MKTRILILIVMLWVTIGWSQPAPIYRQFFTTNTAPVVQVTAGSNAFVTFTQAGQTRTYRVDIPSNGLASAYGSNVIGAVLESYHATNADFVLQNPLTNQIYNTVTTVTNQLAGKFQQGQGTVASGSRASAFGLGTIVNGQEAAAFGQYNRASASASFCAGGQSNIVSGVNALAYGLFSEAGGPASFAGGKSCKVTGEGTVGLGRSLIADNIDSTWNTMFGVNVAVGGTYTPSNSFFWNGDWGNILSWDAPTGGAFVVKAPAGIYLYGPILGDGSVITGNGSGLTNLSASSLASGTVPSALLPSGFTNAWIEGGSRSGIFTNYGGGLMTGGRTHTNYSTGNWIQETNGTISLGPTNAAATITLAGATGNATIGGTLFGSNDWTLVGAGSDGNIGGTLTVGGFITNAGANGSMLWLTNRALANTFTHIASPTQAINGYIIQSVTNNVEKFSVTSAGALTTAGGATFGGNVSGSSSVFSLSSGAAGAFNVGLYTALDMTTTKQLNIGDSIWTNINFMIYGITLAQLGSNGMTFAGSVTATNSVTSYATITATNFLLSTVRWVDSPVQWFWASAGPTAPEATAVTNNSAILGMGFTVAGIATEKAYGACQVNHNVATSNSTLYTELHLHVSPTTVVDANTNVAFTVIQDWANIGGTRYGPLTNVLQIGLGTNTYNNLMEAGHLSFTNFAPSISAITRFTVFRSAASSNAYTGTVILDGADVHYPIDRLGSSSDASP